MMSHQKNMPGTDDVSEMSPRVSDEEQLNETMRTISQLEDTREGEDASLSGESGDATIGTTMPAPDLPVMASGGDIAAIIKEGKIYIADIQANPGLFNNKTADEIAGALRSAGYEVDIKRSIKSRSGAMIIKIKNRPAGGNIDQVQVSPGGGRHGVNPYVKISTSDQGIIKIVNGSESTYRSDRNERAIIIFTG